MSYALKGLACNPQRIKGMSEKLIVSHYENNYGGAVKRLNAITAQLAEIESLINRFIDQLSQVSSGDFCMLVPCVERGFGGANGVAIGKPGLASAGEMMAKAGRIVRV